MEAFSGGPFSAVGFRQEWVRRLGHKILRRESEEKEMSVKGLRFEARSWVVGLYGSHFRGNVGVPAQGDSRSFSGAEEPLGF